MIEVADVLRRFADGYLSAHGAAILPSHRRAIADILACRTQALGGHLWRCDHCSAEVYSYHSCKNRSCPKCHTDQTERWLAARKAEVLACPYFHVTITIPEELREVLRANQKDGYALLMKAAAEAIIELARDRRYVGGSVGVLAVLHTWTQQLLYHPHVHCLVTGGGVSDDGRHWHEARNGFLVPYAALAELVRGKLRAALAKRRPDLVVPEATWSKRWVVHCTAWGEGDEAVLRYLARYVFRVAITNSRIVGLDDNGVTFRHKHRASNRWRTTRLSGHEFMRRFLQHVLPKGLHKVRYYGLWHASRREQAARARLLLELQRPTDAGPEAPSSGASGDTAGRPGEAAPTSERRACPCCKQGYLTCIGRLYPKQASGPWASRQAVPVTSFPTHVRVTRRPPLASRLPRRASNAATSAGHRCLTAQTRPSGDDRPCSPSPPVPRLESDVELRPSRPRLKFP